LFPRTYEHGFILVQRGVAKYGRNIVFVVVGACFGFSKKKKKQ